MFKPNTFAVLLVATSLLTLDVALRLLEWSSPRPAHGESGRSIIITGSRTQNEAYCYAYDPTTQQLISYRSRTNSGIELMGIRKLASDFNPKIIEFPPDPGPKAVRKMQALAERLAEEEEEEKEKAKN